MSPCRVGHFSAFCNENSGDVVVICEWEAFCRFLETANTEMLLNNPTHVFIQLIIKSRLVGEEIETHQTRTNTQRNIILVLKTIESQIRPPFSKIPSISHIAPDYTNWRKPPAARTASFL